MPPSENSLDEAMCATVPWSAQPRWRPAWPSISSFYRLQPYGGAVGQAVVNCCQPSFPGGRPTNLEWSTGWSDIRWIVDHIPPATENSPFSKSFPGYLLDI